MPPLSYSEIINRQPRYTHAQVVGASEAYFGNGMPASAFADKYALRDPYGGDAQFAELTPDDMHDRIAAELARTDAQFFFGEKTTQAVLERDASRLSDSSPEQSMPSPEIVQQISSFYDSRFEAWRESIGGFRKLVPQGSPMYAMGNRFTLSSLSNCVVVEPPSDNFSDIIEVSKNLANLYKRRAGVGTDLSELRPYMMPVNNSAITSTGAFSFSSLYSHVTRLVGQNGRRGALMLTMHIKHPDADRFATMKQDTKSVTGANISLKITDEFMHAVERDEEFTMVWPVNADVDEYLSRVDGEWREMPEERAPIYSREKGEVVDEIIAVKSQVFVPSSPRGKKVFIRKVRARDLWDVINDTARRTAEPGLLFWDNYTDNLPAHFYPGFESKSTNPCSEICLSAFDSCRLLSINLTGFIVRPFREDAHFDFEAFKCAVRDGMRAMDNIVELEIEALRNIMSQADEEAERSLWQKLLDAAVQGRRTGLGLHALGDALAQLRLRYDSEEGIQMAERIYEEYMIQAYDASADLAIERGVFPAWDWEIDRKCEFIQRLPLWLQDKMASHGRRNISLLTNAPTGTVSMVCQTSSGIEPTFRFFYTRRKKINPSDQNARVDFIDETGDKWQHFGVFEKNVERFFQEYPEYLEEWNGIQAANTLKSTGAKSMSELEQIWHEALAEALPRWFVASNRIDPLQRVDMQGRIQKFVDHGISSTLNLPKGTTTQTIQHIYETAWKAGLKGVTVYVDGSRDGVLVSGDNTQKTANDGITDSHAPKRPKEGVQCDIHYVTVEGKKWLVLVGLLKGRPYEVFGGRAEKESLDEFGETRLESILSKDAKRGVLIKRKKEVYDLLVCKPSELESWLDGEQKIDACDIGSTIENITGTFDEGDYAKDTLYISALLRHGMPIDQIVKLLRKDKKSSIVSFTKVMARVLSRYIVDSEGSPVDPSTICKSGNCM
jgi:ribonucleoside-diphosphate reductase alpha chain